MSSGFIVLESGEVFPGLWHGGDDRAGEVVFNTGHSGYEEMATDPSYFSQILVLTAPMQGNYGADREIWESRKLWIQGFVALEIQDTARERRWKSRLIESGIPLVTEADTRRLVLRLRDGGTPWGALVKASDVEEAKSRAKALIAKQKTMDPDWVHLVSRPRMEEFTGEIPNGPRVAILDFGCKENTLRELKRRCSRVAIFPSRTSASEIKEWKPDGIMLSNGPGDPKDVQVATETVRDLLGWRFIFGICMGHQILALALGAKTYRLKFGHRGGNHPIKDQVLQRIYVTSQNHGYAVDEKSLPAGVRITHTNLNDQSVSGIFFPERKCLSVQFHPESHPGPHDASSLFDFFIGHLR